jgi:hypothetical protein
MARPSSFTPARAALIVTTIRETGCSLGAAARVAGIGETTLRDWRKRGAEELEQTEHQADIDPEREPESFGEFVMTLEHALAGIESQLTKCLIDAARKDWRAAAWWLERRRPEVYGDAKVKIDDDAPNATTARVIYLVDSDKAQELLSAKRAESKT